MGKFTVAHADCVVRRLGNELARRGEGRRLRRLVAQLDGMVYGRGIAHPLPSASRRVEQAVSALYAAATEAGCERAEQAALSAGGSYADQAEAWLAEVAGWAQWVHVRLREAGIPEPAPRAGTGWCPPVTDCEERARAILVRLADERAEAIYPEEDIKDALG